MVCLGDIRVNTLYKGDKDNNNNDNDNNTYNAEIINIAEYLLKIYIHKTGL